MTLFLETVYSKYKIKKRRTGQGGFAGLRLVSGVAGLLS